MKESTYTQGCVIICVALFLSALNSYGQIEDYSQWAHSKDITINTTASGYGINQDVRNFPYLVRLNADGFDFSQAKDNGEDIRFANSDATHLHYQIDSWNKAGKTAAIWVKTDVILGNNSSQYIRMHWGKSDASDSSNSRAVFETGNDFTAVWHFSSSSAFSDATANAITLTNNSTNAIQSSIIGEGRALDGTANTNLASADNPNLSITDYLTLSAWVKPIDANTDQKVMGKSTWPPAGYLIGINIGVDPEFWDASGANHRPSGGIIQSKRWSHIAATWSKGGQMITYLNGEQVNSIAASSSDLGTNTNPFYIGCAGWDQGSLIFNGEIDEPRLEHTARSADWIKLGYLNQKPVADAAPTIMYPDKNIVLLFNQPVEVIPAVTGLIDSITIVPPTMPLGLFFDTYTGSIKGNTMSDLFFESYIVTAYNDKGFDTDTITITISPTSILTDINKSCPCLIGIKGGDLSKIHFSVPSIQKIRELTFTLYDCKGAVIWSSQLGGSMIKPGIQSIRVDGNDGLGAGIYFLEMKAKGFGSEVYPAQNIKTIVVR